MHIPPYYKKPGWQRFFVGMFMGGVLAFAVFLFMYGTHVEGWIEENVRLRTAISDLEKQYDSLNKDNKELTEKNSDKITVKSVDIEFVNEKKMLSNGLIDRLSVYKLRELANKQLPDLIGKDITSLSENVSLLYSALESKIYKIDEFAYELKVERILFHNELKISLLIIVSKK